MKKILIVTLIIWMIGHSSAFATPPDSSVVRNLQNEIYYLASDKLEGRNTGSKGEKLAYEYIIDQYKEMGIEPKGEGQSYLQSFTFSYGKKYEGKNEVIINGTSLQLNKDFFPINLSGDGSAKGTIQNLGYGIVAPDIQYDDYKNFQSSGGKIFLMECSTPDGDDAHSKFSKYSDINAKIDSAEKRGAVAIIFTNSKKNADNLKANLTVNSITATIPVIFVKWESLQPILKSSGNTADITAHLEVVRITGHNVIGFIDNGASNTVVIGAHYDHLGNGEYGNSLYVGPPAIHNGADDNASGTAGVLELARFLKNNGVKEKNNFLFINFSGEELGLIGSKYWVDHATYDTSKINFMVNMDMIGRYNPDKGLEISGLGTSPKAFDFIHTLSFDSMKIKPDESGTGPSDHTSFYYADIPVLNFFTGAHEDYHKPTDDADKINYIGETAILHLIESILLQLGDDGVLAFTHTKEISNSDIPQFKVRLGIIPDYLFEGPGLRVDGVSPDQPASKAGILKGDIILKLGDYEVSDIMAYMKGLAAYQKGDSITVKIKRNGKELELPVTF